MRRVITDAIIIIFFRRQLFSIVLDIVLIVRDCRSQAFEALDISRQELRAAESSSVVSASQFSTRVMFDVDCYWTLNY